MYSVWKQGETARAQQLAAAVARLASVLARESNPAPLKMANIPEARVRKGKTLNPQCINHVGIYKNHKGQEVNRWFHQIHGDKSFAWTEAQAACDVGA